MTVITENIAATVVPAAGGIWMAASSPTNMGVIIGAAIAGAGIAGALGMLLAGAIKELEIPRMTGLKRLGANWLAGICSIPFVSRVHRNWFPEEEIGMVAAGLAGAVGLLGVTILTIALPAVIQRVRGRAQQWGGETAEPLPRPKVADRRTTDTVRLAPPDNKPPGT